MKNPFAKFFQAASLPLLGLIVMLTGAFSFLHQANAQAGLGQRAFSSTASHIITASPNAGFGAHVLLLIEETEVEETELETEDRSFLASNYFSNHAFSYLNAHVQVRHFALANAAKGSLFSGIPLFIAIRVLRL